MIRSGRAEITERSIKHCSEDGSIGGFNRTCPSGDAIIIIICSRILYSPRCAVAFSTEGVEIESEGGFICTAVYVGFGSGGRRDYIFSDGHKAYMVLKMFVTENGELAFAVFLFGSIILAKGF